MDILYTAGNTHTWTIIDTHGEAATLVVDPATLEVLAVDTRPDRRREGLATALWNAATEQMPVVHAHPNHRTPEGEAFAFAVGGDAAPCTMPCDCDHYDDNLN